MERRRRVLRVRPPELVVPVRRGRRHIALGRRAATATFVGVLVTSCGSDDDGFDLLVQRGLDVAGITVTDVFAPSRAAEDPAGYPLVVMLHGGDGDPADMVALATAVAEGGAVVHVPTWPVVSERLTGAELDAAYHDQVEAVVCALRFARRTAPDHGADADDLTLLGHSAGGFVGASVAIVDEPPWPGIDCDVGVDHRPRRFIGTSGDYSGSTLYARSEPDVAAPYAPLVMPVTNDELEVRLVHGFADDTILPDVSFALRDRAVDRGLDAEVLALDVRHGAPTDPAGAADFVADQVLDLLRGEPTAFEPERSATLSFADDRCLYDGPVEWPRGEAVAIGLDNDADVELYFVFAAFVGWRPADDDLELDGTPWGRVEDPPDDLFGAAFLPVDAGDATEMAWAFADGSRPWMLWCLPRDDHPAAGFVHPAAELVPLDAPAGS